MGGARQASRHGLRIFISYRREDTPGYAGRVYDYLVDRFGEDRVFIDIDTIRPGSDFTEVIAEALDECDVLLALIGRTWLTRTDGKGRRRLDDPDDFVRVELEAALRRSITLIPVLVQDAKMPAREELPGPLARVATRQAFEISDRRWRTDITALVDELERLGSEKAQQPEPHGSGGHARGMFGPYRLVGLLGASRPGPSTTEPQPLAPRRPARRRRRSVLVAVVSVLVLVLTAVGLRLLVGSAADPGAPMPSASPRPTEPPGVDVGSASQAQLKFPYGVGLDAAGRIYIADSGNLRVRRVDGPTISTIAGTGVGGNSGDGGPAIEAQTTCHGVAIAADGAVLITAIENNNVRKVDPAGIISTLAGNGTRGYSGDGGPATQAQLNGPWDVDVGPGGGIYIADTGNHRVRRVDTAGRISTVAGTGMPGFAGDGGPATQAQLITPRGVDVDADGNVYIADLYNNRVRRVDRNGTITTVAGTGAHGYSGDGGPATEAQLAFPRAVAVYTDGTIYIADIDNHRVRRVDSGGTITTAAGRGA